MKRKYIIAPLLILAFVVFVMAGQSAKPSPTPTPQPTPTPTPSAVSDDDERWIVCDTKNLPDEIHRLHKLNYHVTLNNVNFDGAGQAVIRVDDTDLNYPDYEPPCTEDCGE